MYFEDKIKDNLLIRGFTKEQLLNNRGLITAVIDETIIATVKNNCDLPVVSECPHNAVQPIGTTNKMRCLLCGHTWDIC